MIKDNIDSDAQMYVCKIIQTGRYLSRNHMHKIAYDCCVCLQFCFYCLFQTQSNVYYWLTIIQQEINHSRRQK